MSKFFFTILAISIFLSFGDVRAQDGKTEFNELFSKTESYYKNKEEYSLEVIYSFYEEGKSNPLEVMNGQIQKKGQNYYSKIGNTEFIYLNHHFLKINHDEKAMLYSKIEDNKVITPVEISSLMEYFESVAISKNKSEYVCEMYFKENPGFPYSKMVLVINTSNFSILRQELYMISGKNYPWMSAGMQKTKEGKIVISLSPRQALNEAEVFSLSKYIVEKNGIFPSRNFKNYKLYNTQ